jgi:hypothetical protein
MPRRARPKNQNYWGKIMKMIKMLAVAVGLSAITLSCVAQEEDAAPFYIYSAEPGR